MAANNLTQVNTISVFAKSQGSYQTYNLTKLSAEEITAIVSMLAARGITVSTEEAA